MMLLSLLGGAVKLRAQNDKFLKFTERFVHESLALSPTGATAAGYHRHTDARTGRVVALDELLDDYTAGGLERQREVTRELRGELARFASAKLDAAERIDLAIMRNALDESDFDLDGVQAHRHNPALYSNSLGYAIFQPMIQEYAPLGVRVRHIFARLEQIPPFLAAARANLVDTDPVFTQAAEDGTEGNISLLENQLKQLVTQTGSAELSALYANVVPRTVTELRGFLDYLKEDLAKRSTGSWRLGAALYPAKLRYSLGTDLTPDQVLVRAGRSMVEIRAEMMRLAGPLHKEYFAAHGEHVDLPAHERENRVIREVLDKIAEEHPARNALLDEARENLDELRRFLKEKDFLSMPARDNLTVIETPIFIRSSYGVGGFAAAPALEPSLGAYYWVTPIPADWPAERAESKLREYNRYTFKILSIHEALPGHYLQAEHAHDLQPSARRALRAVFASGPYVEGWAVYSEHVTLAAGFLDNSPKLKLMHRKWTLRSVANAILDVRMHTRNMTDEEALDLMMNDAFQERAEAEAKLTRAKLAYAQLPTYFVGLVEWQSIRDAVARAEGPKFKLKAFHDRALAAGPIPLSELRKWMLSGDSSTHGAGAGR